MLIIRLMHNRVCLALLGGLSLGLILSARVQAETAPSNADLRADQIDASASSATISASTRPVSNTTASNTTASNTTAADIFVLFEPPTDEKVDNSRGGASRPAAVKCIHDQAYGVPMTALVPQSGVGLTAAPHPTLLVYVPPTTATQAHLTLRDANQVGLYQRRVQLPQTGGILQLDLPTDSPELAVGETYHWSLALLCQPTQTDMPITSGQIRRIELSDGATLTAQPSLSQAAAYGQSGVWHDMLATLATLRQLQPENSALNANWAELLQAEGLDAIANTPLLN